MLSDRDLELITEEESQKHTAVDIEIYAFREAVQSDEGGPDVAEG